MAKTSKAIRRSRTDTKDARRERAEKRNEDWSNLSPQRQLADLDARLGKGVGATKQRAKLQAKIDSAPVKKQKTEPTPTQQVIESNQAPPKKKESKENKERQPRKKS
jgi:hypothetical protein